LQQKSRENARLPMQWNSQPNYGFTTGQPWLKPLHHDDYSVEKVLKMKNNVFDFYRALIFLRKHKQILINGQYKLLNSQDNSVYSYERINNKGKILVMANFTDQVQERKIATGFDLLLGNYEGIELNNETVTLRPYESVMLEK
jgi:Glycosidases